MNADTRTNVKILLAAIGGSAVMAAAALTTAIGQEQATPVTVTSSGMTIGATSTQATPASTPTTSMAVPLVKAKPFGGSGS